MDIWVIIGFLFVGFIFYYVMFGGPPSTMIYTSLSESNVMKVKNYVEGNGVQTYMKSDLSRYHKPGLAHSDLVHPTLHVVDSKDRKRALKLIREAGRNGHLDLT